MNVDKLMEFIEGDEEMGEIELYGRSGRIDIRNHEAKKVLHLHFYAAYDYEYRLLKQVLDENGVNYHNEDDFDFGSEKIAIDVDANCIFSRQDCPDGDPEFLNVNKGEYIALEDASAHLQIIRKDGQKKLEIDFFIGLEEYNVLTSFLNCYGVGFSEFYDEFMGAQLKVNLDVKFYFLPFKSKSD